MNVSGIVLAGGHSRRFGSPKALATIQAESLLQLVVSALGAVCDEVLVVCGPGSELPDAVSTKPLRLVEDRIQDAGPLAGIASGLAACRAPLAFLAPVDAPGLSVPLLRWLIDQLWDDNDAVVAVVGGRPQPLQAVLRRSAAWPAAESLLESGERRALALVEALRTRFIEEPELRLHDPELLTFASANTPSELAAIAASLERLYQDG